MLVSVALALAVPVQLLGQQKSTEQQVAEAVLAAPADMREDATVYGYRGDDTMLSVIREGTGDMMCHADNPAQEGITVACWHKSLEPYMARGRELTAQGITGRARVQQRLEEANAGQIPMPERAAEYILDAPDGSFDGEAFTDARVRMVIYVKGATPETLGIPAQPSRSGPWIMYPGTAAAHIMLPAFP